MREISVAVFDEDATTRRALEGVLDEDAAIEIVGRGGTDRVTPALLQSLHPDIVVVALGLQSMSAWEIAGPAASAERPATIFLADNGADAARAFDAGAVDYVVKPVDRARFRTAIERAKTWVRNRDFNDLESRLWRLLDHALATNRPATSPSWPARVSLKVDGDYHIVGVRDIVWAEAQRDLVKVSVAGQVRLVRESLQQFEKMLDPTRFSRVHRSFLVNLEHVVRISAGRGGEATLWMTDGAKIPASRSSRPDLTTLTGREPEPVMEFARAFQFKSERDNARNSP